jgi:phosphoribosylaminoimidazolecarboxamide formyltransferase/IMP cyclohydrolase
MARFGLEPIDLLVVNLYPFAATVAKPGVSYDEAIENIDIGGPAMIRAAAKNHDGVAVVVTHEDYARVLAELQANDGATTLALRKALAAKAYARTAAYDAAISNWFAGQLGETAPAWRALAGAGARASLWREPASDGGLLPDAESGAASPPRSSIRARSFLANNLNDTDAVFELVAEFDPSKAAAVAIIKHANPCGVATAASLREAYLTALRCDSVSAFGGIIALNRTIDAAAAEEITRIFTEVVIAPDATDEAKAIFAAKKNLRLLTTGGLPDAAAAGITVRSVAGGLLVQSRDNGIVETAPMKVVTKRQPTAAELADLKFALKVAKHVKSNAIVCGWRHGWHRGRADRAVDGSRIASWKAAPEAAGRRSPRDAGQGAVVASDALFLFADGLLAAAEAGATAVSSLALDARRRGQSRRAGRPRPGDGVHRHAPLPSLMMDRGVISDRRPAPISRRSGAGSAGRRSRTGGVRAPRPRSRC